jgi:hypothetical protein
MNFKEDTQWLVIAVCVPEVPATSGRIAEALKPGRR